MGGGGGRGGRIQEDSVSVLGAEVSMVSLMDSGEVWVRSLLLKEDKRFNVGCDKLLEPEMRSYLWIEGSPCPQSSRSRSRPVFSVVRRDSDEREVEEKRGYDCVGVLA